MKKDIPFPKVEDVAVAVVPEQKEGEETGWSVYLINLSERELNTVIVSSKGYGPKDGEEVKTSTLRQLMGDVPPKVAVKVEGILEAVFELTNEYWVSYWYEGQLYDKKYTFVRGSINEENFTKVTILNKRGVMIK